MNIVIVDDQDDFRTGLCDLLGTVDDFKVVGEAADGKQAVDLVCQLQPDIVLMDIRMPRMDGITATRSIHAQWPNVCVLVLTTFDEDDLIAAAIQAGAMGYLLKGTPIDALADIIRLALRGYATFSRAIVAPHNVSAPSIPELSAVEKQADALSQREREVWRLIGLGATNRDIAISLSLTEGTVKNYVTNILSTLGARHRTEAALLWRSSKN